MKKTILITGTSSGLGKTAAIHFAAKGWNVIATMRSPEKEQELTKLDNILVTKLDVQQPATIASAIQIGIDTFGQIDVLVNNAGYGEFGLFENTPEDQVSMQFDVNVFGVMNTIRTILPHFREKKAGTIINISSGAGRFTLPLISLYAASKFALEGFSEALSFELAALGIGVKIVEPGGASTNFSNVSGEKFSGKTPIADYNPFLNAAGQLFATLQGQRLATSEEVAEVIYTAVTDGTDTLRYVVGNEDFKNRMKARSTMPDQDYINSIKDSYLKFM
ncbi:SDR family NAD(P)-dependent oxidoreductase [Chitinophaga sp. SYP-B3965]|uniref:SDR family oxidoreductase n=1 Tax=Chitinophaga sp. SYP-B3965 TaxID=2663120 RepID=UPI001299F17A|nr:SDR family oxidoreductase [Chitinophaga sp. SYP-B3965]MRG47283.1 SDR family NAD(P)-dependent oxidoreductase [Chitinophaga sp. SYP-B3965]